MASKTEVPIGPQLRRLLDETSDLIESPTFSHVLTLILDAAFSLLVEERIAGQAYHRPAVSSTARVQEIVDDNAKAKLASTLAVFCRQAHNICSHPEGNVPDLGGGNDYLAAMESVRELEAFAAVIYTSNFEFEAPETQPASTERAQEPVPSARPTTADPTDIMEDATKETTVPESNQPGIADSSPIDTEGDLESAWSKAVEGDGGPKE